ncbi:hypothetical protein BH18GEM1_BH18GEM1_05400 [soil metagenome]
MLPPQSPDPARAPIFIVGSGRSGTSLLRAMLNAHPRVHLLQESAFHTWTEMPGRWVDGARRLEFYYRSFSFAWLGLDPEELRAIFPAPVPREQLPQVYRAIMRAVAERHGKPRFGDKNPMSTVYLDRIFAGFPDARVVRMVRDPRGMLASFAGMPFPSPSIVFWGLLSRRGGRKLAPFLDRILTIRMEDLMADPRGTMAAVLDFVDEPWDDAVLDHPRHLVPDDGPPFPWAADAYEPLRVRNPSWPRRLTPAQIRLIERLNRPLMRQFAYPPADLPAEPGARQMARAVAADVARGATYLWRAARMVRRLFGRPPADAAEAQRLLFGLNPAVREHHPDWSLPDPPALPGAGR